MNRRDFLKTTGERTFGLLLFGGLDVCAGVNTKTAGLPKGWLNPSREFSLCPFWFWNDNLSEKEIDRQLANFQAHEVHAFVIHPRAGLPRSIGWMSERMIYFMCYTIELAHKRKMWVVLYDEGMYPSGSSSGQVVAQNKAYRTRGLFCVDLDEAKPGSVKYGLRIDESGKPAPAEGINLIAEVKRKKNGHRVVIFDRSIRPGYSYIRGLHFLEENPPRRSNHKEVPENKPPAADILNPEAVACFIRLVYQRYYDEFKTFFGKTVKAIFTDEPSLLAKGGERGAVPGTHGILEHINRHLGYDFTQYLPTLWYRDEPDAERYRRDYNRALQGRLEETFYRQISQWCSDHGIALTGHPMGPDDIGHLRHFHIPGQDIVWRYIEPGKKSALEGEQSTQAKCASSAMIHLGRRRNSNEYCGAFGHNFTFEEMKWLTHWLIVRGCNLLYPHAFYYSIRGPRVDERPPDVGPNSPWWKDYKPFALACQRLCWLNTDSKHICELAILGRNDYLPWRPAKICFQNQRDFNYLEARHLWEDADVSREGIRQRNMHYKGLVLEGNPPQKAQKAIDILDKAGRIINWNNDIDDVVFIKKVDQIVKPDIKINPPAKDLRVRHVVKNGVDFFILFNEGENEISFTPDLNNMENGIFVDPYRHDVISRWSSGEEITFARHEIKVLKIIRGK
ncbi:MAG: hypothetical protein GWN67_07670 [Phycisphaerae bacterium]|nr:hypothetical protein [Phycisphaerae bacterium]NIP54859.1 hypothetical protein [Phycisphaerae bacterium]NIS52167.1 hypothetical protein [Phycisphaerae bacterium]NIU11148.1 hypothetical protein [Phycisphaerae bacterium]NIU56253.1 hypothetical protein [Phycisphaerae bacterium]